MIVQELHQIQSRRGYLPEEELRSLADRLRVPLYRIEEVASFFPHFRKSPPPEVEVHVCRDMACRLRGAVDICHEMQQALANKSEVEVHTVSCLGRCDRAPAMVVTHTSAHRTAERFYYQHDAEESIDIACQALKGEPRPNETDAAFRAEEHTQWLIDLYGQDPSLEPYEAVRQFVKATDSTAGREDILQALETAGLLGMGGAGGRAYKKWRDVLEASGEEKFVVCNADESEPGTFKDRELLLRTPHLILEGMILGGLLVGAKRGYVYVRHEYPEQIAAVRQAIARAEKLGACGQRIGGSNYSFELEVFISPGGYICGEQTALIEAMEDRRAEPRNRPPELQTNGLYDKPTLLNNVETFAWVPAVVLKKQGQWYADQGETDSKGMRFFSVSGDVTRPGVYEVPIGITLAELIERSGGMRDGQQVKAVALSGPSGGMLPPVLHAEDPQRKVDLLQTKLDLGVFRKLRRMLGAGIVIYGKSADLLDQAVGSLEFYRDESCGKCVPCRLGTQKLANLGEDMLSGRIVRDQLDERRESVKDLAETMGLTAICGLGQIAANPLITLMDHFPYEARPRPEA